jgi:hypothetical protein
MDINIQMIYQHNFIVNINIQQFVEEDIIEDVN